MKRRYNKTILLGLLFAVGLTLRFPGLFVEGMHDMKDAYYAWGKDVCEKGLSNAFYGVYFPITYIFYGIDACIAKTIPSLWFLPFKVSNLIFELAILKLLLVLFPNKKLQMLGLYWLNPWFIIISAWQGFWDSLMAFFILLSAAIWQEFIKVKHKAFFSGLMLGLAFMAKPQAQSLVLGAAIFLVLKEVVHQHIEAALNYFSGFIVPFIAFSIYFKISGQSIFYLAWRLTQVKNTFPVLVGSEVNIWHPIVRLIQSIVHKSGPIYTPYFSHTITDITLYLTLTIMTIFITLSILRKRSSLLDTYTLSSVLLPQIVIQAHANHFYNASILLLFYIFENPRIRLYWFLSIAIHLYSIWVRYRLGTGGPVFLTLNYEPMLTILGLIQFVVVLLILKEFMPSKEEAKIEITKIRETITGFGAVWKVTLEIKRMIYHPLILVYLKALGVSVGKNTKWYGFPKIMKHKNSSIRIGDGVEVRNWKYSNPLGVNHPLILTTWEKGASISIGDNVGITGGVICAARSINIGEGTLVGANSIILDTDFHPIDSTNRRFNKANIKSREVLVGKNVFIGTNAIILKGITIGNNAVIGAGSVVTKNIAKNTIAVGNPAKKVKQVVSS